MANLENILTLNLKDTGFLHLKKQRYILHTTYAILQVYINDYQKSLWNKYVVKRKCEQSSKNNLAFWTWCVNGFPSQDSLMYHAYIFILQLQSN